MRERAKSGLTRKISTSLKKLFSIFLQQRIQPQWKRSPKDTELITYISELRSKL